MIRCPLIKLTSTVFVLFVLRLMIFFFNKSVSSTKVKVGLRPPHKVFVLFWYDQVSDKKWKSEICQPRYEFVLFSSKYCPPPWQIWKIVQTLMWLRCEIKICNSSIPFQLKTSLLKPSQEWCILVYHWKGKIFNI